MNRMRIRSVIVVFAMVAGGGLAVGLPGCDKKEDPAACGNGLRGIGEDCDCGQDPQNLPSGCPAVNGAPGANCTTECTRAVSENCDNGMDDDANDLVDCADPACDAHPRCNPEAVCNDNLDNDGDGYIDCDDPDCASLPVCEPEDCENGVDDNGDGFVDCQDAQCVGVLACDGVEVCWGGVDDDGDGYTDCDDPDCTGESVCEPEDCGNGLDDDGDFKVDCADRGCIESAECVDTDCGAAQIDYPVALAMAPGQQVVRVTVHVDQMTDDSYGGCDVNNGKEAVVGIHLADAGRLRVVYDQDGAHRFGLYFKAGTGTGCAAAMHTCAVPPTNTSGVLEYGALPASDYFLVIAEGGVGVGGTVDLVLSLVDPNPAHAVELCGNLLDDDGDAQTDCGDLDCREAAGLCDQSACTDPWQLPVADYEAGSLSLATRPLVPMPGEDPALIELDTQSGGSQLPVTGCQGLFGQDRMIHFSLDAPAMIQVGFRQNMTGAGDHVLALFFAGEGCALAEHWCIDPGGIQDGAVTFPGDPADGGRYPPGDYYLVLKAMAGSAGRIDLQIITMDSPQEVCFDNGFDNDGDGHANCNDSNCVAHHTCVLEDCSDPVADVDGDGLAGCADTDPDDRCTCAYACACNPGPPGCDPADYVCDGDYDPDIRDFGVTVTGGDYVLDVDTSVGVRADYDMENCHGTLDSTAPDYVYYFTLETQGDVFFHFTQPPGVEHAGQLMYADRCRACDAPGPSDAYRIYCYNTPSPWVQLDLPPGAYAMIIKAMPPWTPGPYLSGQFNGHLVINP